jgi:riboflavin kinase/FMN adenylyltransferase
VDGLGAGGVLVGENFIFGKGRAGDAALLKTLGASHGVDVGILAPVMLDGVVSSSRIRDALREGRMDDAREMLGRPWFVRGRVQPGAGRGAGLGAPTANIALLPGQEPRRGVYAARVTTKAGAFDGAAYFGGRPTFDDGAALLETTLFDFDGDLYGQEIDVALVAHLRDDAAFPSAEALSRQMERDCDAARAALAGLD